MSHHQQGGNMFDGGNLYQMAGDFFTGMGQAIQGDPNFQSSFDNAQTHAMDLNFQIIQGLSGNTDLTQQITDMSNNQIKPVQMDENGNISIDWNQANPSYGWSDTSGNTYWMAPDGSSVSPVQQSGFVQIASSFIENVLPSVLPVVLAGQVAQLPPQTQNQLQQQYPQYFGQPQDNVGAWLKMILPIVALILIFKR